MDTVSRLLQTDIFYKNEHQIPMQHNIAAMMNGSIKLPTQQRERLTKHKSELKMNINFQVNKNHINALFLNMSTCILIYYLNSDFSLLVCLLQQ